ncbi:glucosamine-6-phosphate deaminase [Oceanobacillus senegalensis]|uniref:glucosamine-6-phosphate deaminase n=1 Tax=Oceanobacillus senegalensis TaxID=1936063 RepID=UPI000A30F646|nr:glucosamine-6-phosphate deaminase [Oceanobacillus senegalensis]
MKIIKVKDYDELSEKACRFIIDKVAQIEKPVLGLATGSTPEGLYQRLVEKNRQDEVSFKDLSTFNLDEYVGLAKSHPNSYYHYMYEKLFKHIDISMDQVHIPSGDVANLEEECMEYEKQIRSVGQIDVQVLGLGVNGHIGFNEPGTPLSSLTHVVDLDSSTRKANARFFDSIDEVPEKAITMGIETIMESREILLLVSGESKAKAVTRLLNGEVSSEFPASILQKHKHVTMIADEEALGSN